MKIEAHSKYRIKEFLTNSWAMELAARLAKSRIIILRYHSIQEDPKKYVNSIGPGIIHQTGLFEEQMKLIAQKFNPVSLDDIFAYLQGKHSIPKRAVAVTFDDGFADNFSLAAPIMEHFGIPATFYVTVNLIKTKGLPWFCRLRHAFGTTQKESWVENKKNRLFKIQEQKERDAAIMASCKICACLAGDAQEEKMREIEGALEVEPLPSKNSLMMDLRSMKKLLKAGHIIGSHTLTHPNIAQITEDDVYQELRKSKQYLEEALGVPVVHFSYPSPILEPHWTKRTNEIAGQVGYRTAVTCTSGSVCSGDNPLALKRVWVPFRLDEFKWYLQCSLVGRCL